MKEKNERRLRAKNLIFSPRVMIVVASVLTAALLASVVSLAWFNYRRALRTMTEIHSPVELNIGAGNKDAIARLDLGNIDVESASQADYVFCVYGTLQGKYILQLAHTTNIPFTYTIYHASVSTTSSAGAVSYTAEDGKTYYYTKSASAVDGKYLNNDANAKDSYHSITYGTYAKVQKNAEPLYWQTGALDHSTADANNQFADYYILTITWGEDAKNDKETDIVYLTAGRAEG